MSVPKLPKGPENDWTYEPMSAPSGEPQDARRKLFDVCVTRVIGSVYELSGGFDAREAAFLLIAREQMDGEYSFPGEDGETITVTVSTKEAHA